MCNYFADCFSNLCWHKCTLIDCQWVYNTYTYFDPVFSFSIKSTSLNQNVAFLNPLSSCLFHNLQTFNKINTSFLLLSSWCNVCSMQTYLLQSSYPPNPDTAQAFCFSKEKITIGSNFLLSHSSFYAPRYSTRFFFKLEYHKSFEKVSQPLLYKVSSNSTCKNVTNVYCFYIWNL